MGNLVSSENVENIRKTTEASEEKGTENVTVEYVSGTVPALTVCGVSFNRVI